MRNCGIFSFWLFCLLFSQIATKVFGSDDAESEGKGEELHPYRLTRLASLQHGLNLFIVSFSIKLDIILLSLSFAFFVFHFYFHKDGESGFSGVHDGGSGEPLICLACCFYFLLFVYIFIQTNRLCTFALSSLTESRRRRFASSA